MQDTNKNRMHAVFNKQKESGTPMVAAFRIDAELWAEFDDFAKRHQTDKSTLLRQMIFSRLKNEKED